MTPVFQTIVDKDHGNCMQAVIASLFDLPLEEVPNFKAISDDGKTNYFMEMMKFYRSRGYSDLCCINKRDDLGKGTELLRKVAKLDGGVNGYIYAGVPSQTFDGVGHAVIVDLDLNIVHDPNPNQLAMTLKPEDVEAIYITKNCIIGKTGEVFTFEEWEKLTEEEQQQNIWNNN